MADKKGSSEEKEGFFGKYTSHKDASGREIARSVERDGLFGKYTEHQSAGGGGETSRSVERDGLFGKYTEHQSAGGGGETGRSVGRDGLFGKYTEHQSAGGGGEIGRSVERDGLFGKYIEHQGSVPYLSSNSTSTGHAAPGQPRSEAQAEVGRPVQANVMYAGGSQHHGGDMSWSRGNAHERPGKNPASSVMGLLVVGVISVFAILIVGNVIAHIRASSQSSSTNALTPAQTDPTETHLTSSVDHQHPTRFAGTVWIRIQPSVRTAGSMHSIVVTWGPWRKELLVELQEPIALTHHKHDTTESVPLNVRIEPPAAVTFGTGTPSSNDARLGIDEGWYRW